MNTYITLVVYPLLLIVLLYGSKTAGKGQFNDEWSSLKQTKMILGFMAICIVCHHTAQQTSVEWLESGNIVNGLNLFNNTGFLFVSLFFFWSGYGLYKSTVNKERYLADFFRKRLLPVWLPYVIVCFLFTFVRLYLLYEKMSPLYKITNLTGITGGYYFGWYVQTILIFYVVFLFAFKYGAYEFDKTAIVWAGVMLWIVAGLCIDHNIWFLRGEWWYNSVILFPVGITFAQFDEVIIDFLKKRYILFTVLSAVLTLVLFGLFIKMNGEYGYYGEYEDVKTGIKILWRILTLMPQILCAVSFTLFVVLLSLKITFNNKILSFLGNHTLDVYLTHAFFLEPLALKYNYSKNSVFYGKPWLLLLVTICLTIPSAILLKKLTGIVTNTIKRGSKIK